MTIISDLKHELKYDDINEKEFTQNIIKYTGKDGFLADEWDSKNYKNGRFVIAFDPNQIKLTTNKTPTADDDIRFSLVDSNKDLIAIHNISETKLIDSLDLGGFAVPSIAITKAELPFENFGEISVLFDKYVIDPKNPKNKVFKIG